MRLLQNISATWWAKGLTVILTGSLLVGCAASGGFRPGVGTKYQYTYAMVAPVAAADLTYRDERIIIQFRPDEAAFKFQLQNVSDVELTVDWDRTSIGVDGRFYPVRHATTLYSDSVSGASIILPPFGFLRDLLLPAENIRYDGTQWVESDLLPTVDGEDPQLRAAIRGGIGKQVSVILPLRFGEREEIYEFAFRVSSIRPIAWRDHQPLARIPAPPVMKKPAGTLDQVTVAVIALGILGFVAFIVSVAKDTPQE